MVTRRAGMDVDCQAQLEGKFDLPPHAFLLYLFRGLGVFYSQNVWGVVQADLANARELRVVGPDECQHRGEGGEACVFRMETQGLV